MQKKNNSVCLLAGSLFLMTAMFGCGGSDANNQNQNVAPSTSGSTALGAPAVNADCSRISTGTNGSLNGFVPFPGNNPWNTNIASAAVDPHSTSLIANYESNVGANSAMQEDFGTQYGESYNVVDSSVQPLQSLDINMYPTESDIMPVPLPNTAVVEGGSQTCTGGGDCHMFILDKNQCWLYETWGTSFNGKTWTASNMAVWDMLNTSDRPYGWTSADAAGLAVFGGLVRYDEVASGVINHAIRFTLKSSANSFIGNATHSAGSNSASFPMGTRFRLKASFDISGFSQANQVILTAMKNYGVILADNGLDFEIAGAIDPRWNDSDIANLKQVTFSNLEMLSQGAAISHTDIPSGQKPSINSFSASATTVSAGQPVTLSWSTANDSWDFIDVLGPVRGGSVVVAPTATTTYTLNSTNIYGRTTQTVTVTVQ
jgi:hypothetical protein